MVSVYGMNDKVGNVSFYAMQQEGYQRPYSDETATLIDGEVRKLLDKEYDRAQALLKKHNNELHILAQELLEKEVLLKSQVQKLIGPRPYADSQDALVEGMENAIAESRSDDSDPSSRVDTTIDSDTTDSTETDTTTSVDEEPTDLV